MSSCRLSKYIELLMSFLHNGLSALDFERTYLEFYLNDTTEWSETEFAVLDELFGDVDAFCADAKLRDHNDLDEEQLRRKCQMALEKLLTIVNSQYSDYQIKPAIPEFQPY